MDVNDIKTIKQALKEMKEFMDGGKPEHVQDAKAFGDMVVKVLEGLAFKVEELEREIGPNVAFINSDDVPHRLR